MTRWLRSITNRDIPSTKAKMLKAREETKREQCKNFLCLWSLFIQSLTISQQSQRKRCSGPIKVKNRHGSRVVVSFKGKFDASLINSWWWLLVVTSFRGAERAWGLVEEAESHVVIAAFLLRLFLLLCVGLGGWCSGGSY